MNLAELLQTVPDLTPEQKRDYARAYQVIQPVFITSNSLTVYVVQYGLYDVFTDVSQDTSSPVRGICLALMDRLRGDSEFNLSETLPLGQANIAMMNTLIQALPQHAQKISALRDTLLAISNKVTYPLANTTLYDVLTAENACPVKSAVKSGGYLTFTTTADTEPHSARVWGVNPRTNRLTVLGNIRIDTAGAYEFKLPTHYLDFTGYTVDDAYGVI